MGGPVPRGVSGRPHTGVTVVFTCLYVSYIGESWLNLIVSVLKYGLMLPLAGKYFREMLYFIQRFQLDGSSLWLADAQMRHIITCLDIYSSLSLIIVVSFSSGLGRS